MTTSLSPAELQRAANTARQFVRQALDLQSLHAVLAELEAKSTFVTELEQRVAAKQAEVEAAQARADSANAAADAAETRAEKQFATAIAGEQDRLRTLTADADRLDRRVTALKDEATAAEERLTRVRAALSGATSAVA